MKKVLFALLMLLPLTSFAKQKVDDSKYLKGAVPEVNGIVTFHKAFAVPGRSKQEIYNVLRAYLVDKVEKSIPAPVDYARLHSDSRDTLAAQICEWQVYKQKFLNLDRSRFRYTLNVLMEDGKVSIDMTRLAYYYQEDQEGNHGVNYRAEEWISDKAALNKAGTKLLPKSNKFRRKTVDRAEEIFEEIMDIFEEKAVQEEKAKEEAPAKKVRSHVQEL